MTDPMEISNLLTSRGANDRCLSCDRRLIPPTAEYQLLGVEGGALRAFARVCLGCGYVHLYATNVLTAEPPDFVNDLDL